MLSVVLLLTLSPNYLEQSKLLPQAPEVREEATTPIVLPTIKVRDSIPKTYQEAYNLAIRQGKPMIVWTGKAVCIPCVNGNKDEFVMLVQPNGNKRFPDDTLTVATPVDGDMRLIGQVNRWEDGHIPTVRTILDNWRRDRRVTIDMNQQPQWR